jgi:hypothetical protein
LRVARAGGRGCRSGRAGPGNLRDGQLETARATVIRQAQADERAVALGPSSPRYGRPAPARFVRLRWRSTRGAFRPHVAARGWRWQCSGFWPARTARRERQFLDPCGAYFRARATPVIESATCGRLDGEAGDCKSCLPKRPRLQRLPALSGSRFRVGRRRSHTFRPEQSCIRYRKVH